MRALMIILAMAIVVAAFFTCRQRPGVSQLNPSEELVLPAELPKLWPLSPFQLTERSGQPVTLDDLKGRVWVADFFYTTCPGPCPMLSSRFSELQAEFAKDPSVRFVSISSDPEKDTPEVLRQYAEHFHATDRWLFLTGEKTAIYQLANTGFKLALAEDRTNTKEPVIHSTKLALVDGEGSVRGVYDGVGAEGKAKLVRDLRRLLAEKP